MTGLFFSAIPVQQYRAVYLMLGINEFGYPASSFIEALNLPQNDYFKPDIEKKLDGLIHVVLNKNDNPAVTIYVDGTEGGDDENTGLDRNSPVFTMGKTIEILREHYNASLATNGKTFDIMILGTVGITENETWDFFDF